MSQPFLQIRSLRKDYGPVNAVRDVTLDVARGEFLTFLGPSGSGKSTTLYILAGFQDPTGGDVLLDGKPLLDIPSHKRNIGMVFQRYTLFPHLSVGENIAFPLRVRRRPKAEIDEKVRRLLKLIRLDGYENRMPTHMSGGQQQRVALARALAYDPPILLMDEPLSALDKKLREELQFEIRRIHQETGVTILYVTHDQEEALRLSDRIAVFSRGVIDQTGTGTELYANPATRFVAEFIGDSNFLDGEIVAVNGSSADLTLGSGQRINGVPTHGTAKTGSTVSIMLRPERINLARVTTGTDDLTGTIGDITFLGNTTQVFVETLGTGTIAVRVPFGNPDMQGLSKGDAVALSWKPTTAHAFCG